MKSPISRLQGMGDFINDIGTLLIFCPDCYSAPIKLGVFDLPFNLRRSQE